MFGLVVNTVGLIVLDEKNMIAISGKVHRMGSGFFIALQSMFTICQI